MGGGVGVFLNNTQDIDLTQLSGQIPKGNKGYDGSVLGMTAKIDKKS